MVKFSKKLACRKQLYNDFVYMCYTISSSGCGEMKYKNEAPAQNKTYDVLMWVEGSVSHQKVVEETPRLSFKSNVHKKKYETKSIPKFVFNKIQT